MANNKIQPVQPSSGKKQSPSMESLNESQLNAVIMDMLHVNENWNRCEIICRGNPITDAGKRLHMFKMLTVVLVPVVVLTGMTANTFIVSLDNYISLSNIRNILYFSIELGWLLRMMQRERDISALYISSKSPQTKDFLLDRYPDTDVGLQNLSFWPTSETIVRREFQTKESFLSYLNRHRYQLESYNRTSKDEVAFYSDSIEVFIKWLYQAIVEARSGTVWPTLVAYQEIVVASEYFGRERGLGVSFYAIGGFLTRDEYLDFVESQDIANITFESARRYSELAYSIYEDTLLRNSSVIQPINEMRSEIRSNKSSAIKGSFKYANWWFENMTVYQDTLREVQIRLASEIDEILRMEAEEDLRNIVFISVVFGIILILCPLIVFAVYSLTSEIQKYSISIANRTKALNKEKKRTDTLLYQMLPRSVAERLKRNEEVGAENYPDATVLFSDIVGFTQIASQCSPMQVVDMLNSLYLCFDERLELFDVYKVETIGDAYMVVSGVPKLNGRRHAAEVATMALDILEHIDRLEIPHLPGTKFKLRIGCHSGPVVAAVVGTKMPRYCLFGVTVSIASMMESLGKANKIHISESMHDLLSELGGFLVEQRHDLPLMLENELKNAIRGRVRTYWLQDHEGGHRLGSFNSLSSFESR
ncbi:uncharacterized protein LOC110460400 [Mizuhopecten yessoensis]|uniref:guanylate cyclase n=1 Tax=Mizuhopecten yessoensis TaxID=6573 RepID=A0A210Q2J3_MIZYE|nr:uncharacterized protein LOC110460400 [Mizuhopecten yessoensis]OWF42954.1 Atrial natriuretic peptide receptor 2 [Mizuhopecten yessoensis]